MICASLKVDVAYPFLLDVYHDYKQGRLTSEEVLTVCAFGGKLRFPSRHLCHSHQLAEQDVCRDEPFPQEGPLFESVQAAFLMLPSYRRFPGDEEFQTRSPKCVTCTTSAAAATGYVAWKTMAAKSGWWWRTTPLSTSCPRTKHCRKNGKPNWARMEAVQQTWLHTLGNLTLTGYNSEYSDHPFAYKRDQVTSKDGNPVGFVQPAEAEPWGW
jgi:hypothetical protein